MVKSWEDIKKKAGDAFDIAKNGDEAVPRQGLKGRVFGPTYRPRPKPTDSADESITVDQETESRTTIKRKG